MKKQILSLFIIALCLAPDAAARNTYTLRSGDTEVSVSSSGEITGIRRRSVSWSKPVRGFTTLDSCSQAGAARVKETRDGGVEISRDFIPAGRNIRISVVDRLTPEKSSIRWEVSVEGGSEPWSTGIGTTLLFPDTAGARFWTTWGNPEHVSPLDWGERPDAWHNPFETRPLRTMHLLYGGHFAKGAGYSVPVISVMYPEEKTGVGLAMYPGDPLLDVHLETTPAGGVTQWRRFNRLERGSVVKFTMSLFLHEADWRAVMAFVVWKYPAYFQPVAKNAGEVCGLGAYSSFEGEIDAAKYRTMGGIVNWKASFDFSYMGMFVPPVPGDTTPWKRFDATSGGEPISGQKTYTTIAHMAHYASHMKALGFSTLNYFNLTEFGGFSDFGKAVAYPDPRFQGAADTWTNPTAFLYDNFPDAILFGVVDDTGWHKRTAEELMHMTPAFLDRPFWTWGGAIITDVGDPAYARFLLNQARLHVEKFPDAQGIAIDRFDWLNEYNWHADDGKTWIGGKPVRALLNSYRGFIPRLARIFHDSGKVVFCNPHMNRLDLMEWIDGVYNEFGHIGHNLNLSAFLTPYKTLICWTPDKETVTKSPDAFFQRHLLMGAFPTAPYPGNDHTIGPEPEVERLYLEYGPMFSMMHGRSWVLISGIADVAEGRALCNVFRTGTRVIVPVVMGTADSVTVHLRHCTEMGLPSQLRVETWYPGEDTPVTGRVAAAPGGLNLKVHLKRGCAFLVFTR